MNFLNENEFEVDANGKSVSLMEQTSRIMQKKPSIFARVTAIAAVSFLCFLALESYAQCGCTFTIPAGSGGVTFDGNAKGVKPGDVICLEAGSRERVMFTNINGASGRPVIIKNCGGEVLLGGPNANSGLVFYTSRYFRVTGTGDSRFNRGIKITQTRSGSSGIVVSNMSSDVEIDHVEITRTGFAGIMAKTDPSSDCSNTSMVRPNFTMYNIKLHNNYVHNIGGEGFYVGNSFYSGTTNYCGSTQYPHEIRGVRIYDNIFDGCGWESIQVGAAVADVEVYNNKIYNYGTADVNSQNGGIQFGLGTSGRLYNNFIKGNPNGTGGQAIVIQGIGNNYVYNNVIVDSPDEAITINVKPTPLATDIVNRGWLGGTYIINNTIVNPGKAAVADFINEAPGNVFYNNLIVTGREPNWNRLKTNYDWKVANNIVLTSIADAKFVNPAQDNYNLQSGSPAVNVGRDVASFGVTRDFEGKGRPSGAAWDVGAFELAGAGNQKPSVNVGGNQTITLPTNTGTVKATASDPDGTIASYQWIKKSGPAATLSNATTPTLTITGMVEGTYVFAVTVTDNSGATATAEMTFTVAPAEVNQPPVANADTDKTITLPTNSVTLNGTGTDKDGTVTKYSWTQVSGPSITLNNVSNAVLALTELVAGTYVFRLTVTDDDGDTDSDDVTVQVNEAVVNKPPVANAGEDQKITLPTNSVNLKGSGSDPDGTIKSYEWTKRSGGNVTMTNSKTATLQLSDLVAGTYVFRLTVTDDKDETAFDEVTVTVENTNQNPVANAGGNKTLKLPSNSTVLNGSGSDTDGSIVSHRWEKVSGPAATMANENTANLTLTNLIQGVYVFRLTVTDDDGATGSSEARVTVNAANVPPTANAGSAQNLTLPANTISLTGRGTDTDGTITAYLWEKVSGPTATLTNANTATVTLSNLVQGTYVMKLTVTDNSNATASAQVSVVVFPAAINRAPVVSAGPDASITLPTNNLSLNGTASDPDGSPLTLLWEKVSGPAVTISDETTATLKLTNLVEGTYVFRFTATDDKNASTSDQVTVRVSAMNQRPTVNAGPDQILTLPTDNITLKAVANDRDGTISAYKWSKTSGGPATLGPDTNAEFEISGLAAGTYTFRIVVTDDDGATATDNIKVTVQTPVNVNPTADAGRNTTITLPTSIVNLHGSGSDSDGAITAFEWTQISGNPATLSNDETPTLTVSGLTEGTYRFRLTVTDNAGGTAFDEVTVIVNPAAANQRPEANAGPDIALTLPNNSTNLIGSGTDRNGSVVIYQWRKVSGPTATLGNVNNAVLSLTNLVEGLYVFRLTVIDDDGATDTDDVQITVLPGTVNQVPSIDIDRNVTVFLPVNSTTVTAVASDPDGSIASYFWTKRSGPAATISGETSETLSLTNLVAGTYTYRITVTDDDGAEVSSDVTITVIPEEANKPPKVVAGEDKTLFLPTTTVTISGSASDSDGSIASYSWTKTSGPPLTMANANSPTVTINNLVAGSYVLRLVATDDDGDTAFDEVTITVFAGPVNQAPVANAGPNQTIVSPNNTTALSGSGFDPDGSIVSYQWSQISGPSSTLESPTSPTLLVNNLVVGSYVFQLAVKDNLGATGTGTVQVTVVEEGINQTPVADAGFDRLISLPENSLEIQGSGKDQDGSISKYEWTKKSGPATGTMAGANTSRLTLTNLVPGTYVFVLTVTDNRGATNSDDVKVTVMPGTFNNNPTVTANDDIYIRLPRTEVDLSAEASDQDGTVDSYRWTQLSGAPATITPDNEATTTVSGLDVGTYVFRIMVTDDKGATSSDDVRVEVAVESVNSPPVVNASAGKVINLPTNTTSLTGSVSDPDGSVKSIAWTQVSGPSTATMSGQSNTTLHLADLQEGTYTFRLTAIDNEGASSFAEAQVQVLAPVQNTVVYAGKDTTLVLPSNLLALVGQVISTQAPIASYVWEQIDGPSADMAGEYPEVTALDLIPGTYTFRFTVIDILGNRTSDDLVVSVIEDASNPLGASLHFSPNDDFNTDTWEVKNLQLIRECPIKIFNAMGKQVFEATSYNNDWDGTLNGSTLKEGDYYYVIDCGNKKVYSGALRLIR